MARESSYQKCPITIVFATSNRSNARVKMKTVRKYTIDDLMDLNYVIPGIPEGAVIKEIGVGTIFAKRWAKKYNIEQK